MRSFTDVDDFCSAVGSHLGDSSWVAIDQDRINLFAEATGDHQWIHVDPERAAAGPFGSTIAHGFLTLGMAPVMLEEAFEVKNVALSMNYGSDKVRFLRPVPVGSRVQGSATLTAIERISMGVRATINLEIRMEGGGKPACVAEMIVVLVPA